jgi:hypothetical protein
VIVGFTGTREGMTDQQRRKMCELLAELQPSEAHHGDCIGADAEFHALVGRIAPVVIHPPSVPNRRAFCGAEVVLIPRSYLERNRNIVDACELLIATPKSDVRKGGTWYTIGYAERRGKLAVIVWPDGTVERREAKR